MPRKKCYWVKTHYRRVKGKRIRVARHRVCR